MPVIPMKQTAVLLFVAGITAAASWSGQSSPTVQPGSIQWYANKAKQQGETSISIRAPRGMHEQIRSLDQAISTYEVIIGTPITSVVQLVDSDHVWTWYKLRVIETLITHPNPEVPAVSVPDALLPVASNEIVVRVPQGTVTVDGIKVNVTDQESHLLGLNVKYLFFLSPDSSGKFGYLRSGSNAVFVVNANDKVAPLVATRSRMQDDLDSSTGGLLDQLRTLAKMKASERLANN